MPEGEKHWGGPVVIGGDNLPSPVRIGLTDLQNIWGASGPPGPPVPASLGIDAHLESPTVTSHLDQSTNDVASL